MPLLRGVVPWHPDRIPLFNRNHRFGYLQVGRCVGGHEGREAAWHSSRRERRSCVGSLGHVLINAGTSWYQALQVERITGQLGDASLDRIYSPLVDFQYRCCFTFLKPPFGGAVHIQRRPSGVGDRGFFYNMGQSIRFRHTRTAHRSLGRCLRSVKARWSWFIFPGTPTTVRVSILPHLSTPGGRSVAT